MPRHGVEERLDCGVEDRDRRTRAAGVPMSTDPLTGAVGSVLQNALDGLAARERATSDNVANIQTPGFLARRVDFESQLRDSVAGGGDADVVPTESRSTEPTRLDGNNVNLDEELLDETDTNMRYHLMLRALDDRFGLLRTALRTGG
jgi:flagellar basal-body rod protein FlgB